MKASRPLRNSETQITDRDEIIKILDSCERCRIGFSDDGEPYMVPINYGYTYIDNVLTVFFHCASEGRKMDIIKKNPLVCFEVDYDTRLNPDDSPGKIAIKYESIVGVGTVQIVDDFHEKRRILGNMMKKFHRYNPFYHPTPLTDNRVHEVVILKLALDEFKAKRLLHI